MFCSKIRRSLYEFALGGLDECAREKIRAHIGVCPACDREYKELAAILKAAEDKAIPQLSAEAWKEFRGDLEAEIFGGAEEIRIRPGRSLWTIRKPVLALAAKLHK